MNPLTLAIFIGLTFLQPMMEVGIILLPLLTPTYETILVDAD